MEEQLNGLILSGGRSARMGMDKGLIDYHGTPQREHLHDLLGNWCKHVYVSCKECHGIPANLKPLPDLFTLDSPLNGILSAFRKHPDSAWLTVPVDMPLIDETVIAHLLSQRKPGALATCYFDSEGKQPEPLLCVWEKEACAFLTRFYEDGNFSPRQFLTTHAVNIVLAPSAIHLNINTPEDLNQYRRQTGKTN